ncbi:hypothetical protein ACH5RR_005443 [Cinchona calisaya]|uniref:Ycf15 n=1 Tax=Cinchona calisaya TaxID=153742 RepID=A0ABD3AL87_9GENT
MGINSLQELWSHDLVIIYWRTGSRRNKKLYKINWKRKELQQQKSKKRLHVEKDKITSADACLPFPEFVILKRLERCFYDLSCPTWRKDFLLVSYNEGRQIFFF